MRDREGEIGNTPGLKFESLNRRYGFRTVVKMEHLNPGGSCKDRAALYMLNDAEERGVLKPGGTIVEATSGNTGIGLILLARQRGYSCVIFTNDKTSPDKVRELENLGARVYHCPSSVSSDDPRSTYKQGERYALEHENSCFLNQYHNMANPRAHYETTGPEIWEQTGGQITHFIAGAGTGGTISGAGRFLKEQNPGIRIWAVDAVGSIYTHYFRTGVIDPSVRQPYTIEGVGKSFIPGALDMSVIDDFIQVSDMESVRFARRFFEEENMRPGYSSGSVLAALDNVADRIPEDAYVVILFADHGDRYLSKIYDDRWVEENLAAPAKSDNR